VTLSRLSAVLLALVGVLLAVLAVTRVSAQGEDSPTDHPPLVMPTPTSSPTPSPTPSPPADDDDDFTQVPTTPRTIDDHGGRRDDSGGGRGRDHPEDD
jgi:hypothetical protein